MKHSDIVDLLVDCEIENRSILQAIMTLPEPDRDHVLSNLIERGLSVLRKQRTYIERRALKLRATDPERLEREEAAEQDLRERLDAITMESMRSLASSLRTTLDLYAESVLAKWTILGGTPLGEATVDQLSVAAAGEERSADGHIRNCVFYRELAARTRPGKKVRDCVSVAEAEALRERVYIDNQARRAA